MHEVIVVGGGPAGLAAAIALAERGTNATVVDRDGGISAERGELLSHGAFDIMTRLGLTTVLNSALQIDEVVSNWGDARMQSHAGSPGLGFHGWGLDRRALSLAMLNRVKTMGVAVHCARVVAVNRKAEGWTVEISNGAPLQAEYLIDASGRPGIVARRQGARILQDNDLAALIWSAPRSTGTAHMQAEAAPDGWWYAVPYGPSQTVGFVTSAQQAKEIKRNPQAFLKSTQYTTRFIKLSRLRDLQKIMDCRSAVLEEMSGQGWIATGDAAAAFDPISSQGLFNALSSGFFAANAAVDVLNGDKDAPLVYSALAARTAYRTHSMTRLQYSAMPFDTSFWSKRASASQYINLRK